MYHDLVASKKEAQSKSAGESQAAATGKAQKEPVVADPDLKQIVSFIMQKESVVSSLDVIKFLSETPLDEMSHFFLPDKTRKNILCRELLVFIQDDLRNHIQNQLLGAESPSAGSPLAQSADGMTGGARPSDAGQLAHQQPDGANGSHPSQTTNSGDKKRRKKRQKKGGHAHEPTAAHQEAHPDKKDTRQPVSSGETLGDSNLSRMKSEQTSGDNTQSAIEVAGATNEPDATSFENSVPKK